MQPASSVIRSSLDFKKQIFTMAAKDTSTKHGLNADNSHLPPVHAATKLRSMLKNADNLPLVCPGVYDGLTARLALAAGFQGLYMTGAGTSVSRTGMADLGIATMTEMAETAATIAPLDPGVPVIADADTGYGSTLNVARTVREYIRAGLAGFHLEDQVVNKQCGHLAGKKLVSTDEYVSRIRAAVRTREQLGSDIVIIARTDALAVTGFDDAVVRLKAAIAAGADVAFLEAIRTKEEARKVCAIFQAMGVPVMYGMVQGSHAPRISVCEAKEIGFSIVVYASLCLSPVVLGVQEALKTLKEQGDCDHERVVKPSYIFEVCGLNELRGFDAQIQSEVEEVMRRGVP